MCCLFGILNYSGIANEEIEYLVNCLAQEATERGTDATGIAYVRNNHLSVYKRPLSAFDMEFTNIDNCVCVNGHTRHATQGSIKDNFNNHPFPEFNNFPFALSHNGVIWNDKLLRQQYKINENKIKTDSYIAVQLINYFGGLCVDSVKRMAENVSGSFTFSINDINNTLWLVKGNSPISIIHIPEEKLYIYASTDNILFSAISRTDFIEYIVNKEFEIITLKAGDILRIFKDGKTKIDNFKYNESEYIFDWRNYYFDDTEDDYNDYNDYNSYFDDFKDTYTDYELEYINTLKADAYRYGYTNKDIDDLITEGYSIDEIEQFIYEY